MNWLIFLLLIAGNCEVWVALVNRVHAWPLSRERLRTLRHIHDLILVVFPFALVGGLGLTGPRLLLGGSWSEVSGVWWFVLSVAGVGFLSLFVNTLCYWLRRPPHVLRQEHRNLVDLEARLKIPLIGPGPHQRLARFPGNEQFLCDFAEKTLYIPRLPQAWEGMTILHLSDWHLHGTVARPYFDNVDFHIP